MTHDQLFKDLLRAFFREFMELFFPNAAARLDFERMTFLDKEVFTDLPEGRRRELDLVAQVYTLDGEPELILVHTEVQAQREREFTYRMFEYYALLRLRYKVPVFPVVVYLVRGTVGIGKEVYQETLFGDEILTYRYGCIGIPELPAVDYAQMANPLAPALAALMNRQDRSALEIKMKSLQSIAQRNLDEARAWLLLNFVETYLELKPDEQTKFQKLLQKEEYTEVKTMQLTYEEKLKSKLTLSLTLSVKRRVLLKLLQEKFGGVPEKTQTRIETIESEEELDQLLTRLIKANSLAELGLE